MNQKGITLIALVITIIVLLILAGISIAMLTGENGILTKATQAAIQTDVAETKEQIKLEIMENAGENGNYTNANVIEAVKKITEKDVIEKQQMVESKKGNSVDLSDLWIQKRMITFTIRNSSEGQDGGKRFTVVEGTTMSEFIRCRADFNWDGFHFSSDIPAEYFDYFLRGDFDVGDWATFNIDRAFEALRVESEGAGRRRIQGPCIRDFGWFGLCSRLVRGTSMSIV